MGKPRCQVHGIVFPGDGETRITVGDGFRVDGGTKESHEQMSDLTMEVHRQMTANCPQNAQEMGQIVREAMKKTGIKR